jgi:signal peptidase I
MAETLYGYQKMVTCPSCGYTFPVNCSQEVDPQDREPADIVGCRCPNCMQRLRLIPPRWRSPLPGLQPGGYVEIADPGASSGDRVLVGKFLYDASLPNGGVPNRHDVVVFKYPKQPQTNGTAMNYIKRLIGLPGETIAICGGDIYVLPPEKSPHYDDSAVKPLDRWQFDNMHIETWRADDRSDEKSKLRKLWDAGEFKILRKAPRVILSMMRIVYDNDHLDPALKKAEIRWRPEGEDWETLDGGKSFRHPSRTGTAKNWLRYRHVLRDQVSKSLIMDFMGYNSGEGVKPGSLPFGAEPNLPHNATGVNWVGDLILECEVKVEKNEGKLILELARAGQRYRATFDLASEDGRCTLTCGEKGDEKQIGDSQPTRLRKGTYKVRFANVDQRLTVWVDGTLPFGDGVNYDPPAQRGPDAADLDPASFGVDGSTVTIQKIKLFRDTYYTTGSDPMAPDDLIQNPDNPSTWGELRTPRVKSFYVQPGHYLCLGDNSPASSDGRSWGLVPERLLLGRALLVYYPFSRAGRIR